MRDKAIIILLISNLIFLNCFPQGFVNGDLEGIVNGWSSLPDNWQNVPFTDLNCIASEVPNDTPNLTNISGPSVIDGAAGNPFSGYTFVSGAFGHFSNTTSYTQEGIMQTVNGLSIGTLYCVNFRQSVVKLAFAIDCSGSWAIFLDTLLVGVTTPSYSNVAFNSIELAWELRNVNFTASSTSHLIKFLPIDDDSNWDFSTTDTTGALYMGLDSISLTVIAGINENGNNLSFEVFPNPAKEEVNIKSTQLINEIELYDSRGQFIQSIKPNVTQSHNYELSTVNFSNGMYIIKLKSGDKVVYRRVVVLN